MEQFSLQQRSLADKIYDLGITGSSLQPVQVDKTTSLAREHELAIQAINSFSKFDKNGDRFLSPMELETAQSGDDRFTSMEQSAAKYMSTNLGALGLMSKDHDTHFFGNESLDRKPRGISEQDLQNLKIVTERGFNPYKTAFFDAIGDNKLKTLAGGLWGASSALWTAARNPFMAVTTAALGVVYLAPVAIDGYERARRYSELAQVKLNMVPPEM